MAQLRQRFEYLDSLIGGWFHQDFDIAGDSIEEIMFSYKAKTKLPEQDGLIRDIRNYLAEHRDEDELTGHFARTFKPDIEVHAWGLSTREFLSNRTPGGVCFRLIWPKVLSGSATTHPGRACDHANSD